ncbi:hypothetical protein [Dyella psychrodurans]|uniref:Glycosyltransferase RgtA/B/C/D-like domain-containing protein n=1 Tax=Dyella psychrodurans TaxID=1927960 RepID=A0A370X5E1_9GAMM|nr:hypothetical protein [Dyella psychrodurans]RDS83415.1 hypothetical protein DWU99_12870 [Dyella psychrodurans]
MNTDSGSKVAARIEWTLLGLGVLFSLSQLILGFSQSILDQYAFRQTQTAISVYWMLKGDSWLAYATPVLGAPWALPFEFPLYQWIVALLAECCPFLSLDEAGRLVSEFFFFACLWPLWRISTHCKSGRSLFRICAGLLLCSPIYVFWSRSFMIESTALFFSLWFVASITDYVNAPSAYGFAETTITGALAACIKITTFVGFSFAGALVVLYILYANRNNNSLKRQLFIIAAMALTIVIAIASLYAWTHFSDGLKMKNILATGYTSEALKTWNFGTLAQRKSPDLRMTIFRRAPNEALGTWLFVLALTVLALRKLSRPQLLAYGLLLFLFAAPFFVFPNLHVIHHYYQYANSIFLVLAAAYLIFCIAHKRPKLLTALLLCAISFDAYGYVKFFYQSIKPQNRELQVLLASYARRNVNPDDVVAGFGLDWSSEVPYYAERRALLISNGTSDAVLLKIAADPGKFADGKHIGLVIVCPNSFSEAAGTKTAYNTLLDRLTRGRTSEVVGSCVTYK